MRTLSGRVLAFKSLSGSLNRRLVPSILIFNVTRVSWLVVLVDAMTAVIEAVLCQLMSSSGDASDCLKKGRRTVDRYACEAFGNTKDNSLSDQGRSRSYGGLILVMMEGRGRRWEVEDEGRLGAWRLIT